MALKEKCKSTEARDVTLRPKVQEHLWLKVKKHQRMKSREPLQRSQKRKKNESRVLQKSLKERTSLMIKSSRAHRRKRRAIKKVLKNLRYAALQWYARF